ncbi:sugar phosphate isomerase/epimerase family protein [Priestia megaterium]|uniref:sugar phosphate isomerase/epimerase family protein n=1 Tax=Priestia megaterium TaxID=1404 RepID=UPI00237ABCF4|nr:sugar phosphate isomerase/epimerase [Priestia megaterium]MDD9792393.1 sugar phosphate isomerase/epimerase [Priestia megaterium]
MSLQIGLQLFSAKKAFTNDRRGALKRIAQIGYQHIEVPVDFSGQDSFGIGELTASSLKHMTDQVGLNIIATHVLVTDESQWEQVINYNKEIGCEKVIIPLVFFKDYQAVKTFSETLNRFGKQLKENGMKLYYHNHFHEFQRFNGEYALDILLEHTDSDLVGIELDTYWALRAGIDVNAYLKKLGSRCEFIHQKDLPASVEQANIFEMINEKSEITLETLQPFVVPENFTETGEGVIDIATIIRTAESSTDTQYIIVEQDATFRDELESIEISYKNLSSLMKKVLEGTV